MKIKKLQINNYRMLKDLDFDLEDELSLVIGKNNCGKTSLLSALEKFIGSQSSSNNFTFDDFNSDFQDSLFNAINDNGTSWSALTIKGIELFIYIEYDDSDNLSNIQPLMLDLDPNNNIVILKLEYTLSDQMFHQLFDDFSKYSKKYEGNLIDDKVVIDGVTVREPKRDRLIQHLFKIQELISLFDNKEYNELIRRTSFSVQSIADKSKLKKCMDDLKAKASESIEAVINYADSFKLCIVDDKLSDFIENNDYLYWRIKDIAFHEFQSLYLYLEGYTPFSTQHKIKGLEFENVLIVLHNGGWNNYNFEYLFDAKIESALTPSQKKSYPRILHRTKKLFYVCCTRAKDNLIVYYPSPSPNVLEGAKDLFGVENCINLDTD